MAASREAHDTHILLINMPYSSTVSHGTHRLISITERNIAVALRHAILQNEVGNALLVEIFSPLMSLMFHGEMRISASRTVYHSTTARVLWQIAGEFTLTIRTILKYELARC